MGGDDLAANGYPRERFLESLDEHLETHQQVGETLATRFARFATRPAG
jgi:hypothetical protein